MISEEEKNSSLSSVSAKASAFGSTKSADKRATEGKEEKVSRSKAKEGSFGLDANEMAEAGLHFGHRVSYCHPRMKPYISGVRNTVHIIDLEKTIIKFKEALNFIQGLVSEGKKIIVIGTQIQAKELVKKMAQECDLSYVSERWVGGTFTNFEIIKKRIDYFKDLENKKVKKELEKYTKKERAKFDQEIKDLELKFGGIKNLDKVPDAILILDMKKDRVAIDEARAKNVKIIAIADTNVDPNLADYPIPANDNSISSIKYILDKIIEVIKKNKK